MPVDYSAFENVSDEVLLAALGALPEDELGRVVRFARVSLAQADTPAGFGAYFELMHGTPLHREGEKWIANAYEAKRMGLGLAQECHRESGKTTVFSKFFMSFRVGHEPEKVSQIIRINDQKAQETATAIARIIEHDERWAEVFPHVVPDKNRGWGSDVGYYVRDTRRSEAEWQEVMTARPEGATFIGRGWKNGAIIGSRVSGVLLVDDIHDEENTSSARQLAAVKKFYTDTLMYCKMESAWEVWNYTPWVYNDLYAFLKETGEYLVSKTPVMVAAEEGAQGASWWKPTPLHPDYPEAGNIPHSGRWWKLYWPEAWSYGRLAKVYRKSGVLGFARMMLLDLEATKGYRLRADWLHEFPAQDVKPSWPVYMGVDYASVADRMRGRERDYFGLAIGRGIPGGGLVLVDGYRGHLSKGEALSTLVSYAALYPTLQLIGVENIGKGEEFYNDLVLTNDTSGRVLPLMAIQHGKRSKGERFENWLGPRFQAARLWVTDTPGPFVNVFRDEWLLWPNGSNDDALDAVYMLAVAGEGALPIMGKRSFGREGARVSNPFAALGRI